MASFFHISITEAQKGERLDKALAALLAHGGAEGVDAGMALGLSRARLQALIKDGNVALEGGAAIADLRRKVTEGEVYRITLPTPEKAEPEAQAIPLDIVYEDADLLVINKPPGLVVHPAAGNKDHTLVNALLAHCGASLSGIGGVARPGIVHRLDKDTSGLMVVAKHDAAHQALSKQFADRSLSRVYHALVWGTVMPAAGEIHGAIGRHSRDRKKMAVVPRGGKPGLTHYKVVEYFGEAPERAETVRARRYAEANPTGTNPVTLIECTLLTGRTHQIRVHMAHLKFPVVGDQTYGRKRTSLLAGGRTPSGLATDLADFPRQALHAAALKFTHPRTGKAMNFLAPLPEDFAKLLKKLRRANR